MSHRVPNLDALSPQDGDVHRHPSPSGKAEASPAFHQRGLDSLGDEKRTDGCIFNLDGMASHVPWMRMDGEEKRENVFEMSHESALAADVPLSHTSFQEDEMLSWLQYPLDDSFSKSYCSEQHGEQAYGSLPSQNLFQGVSNEKLLASSFLSQQIEKDDSTIGAQSAAKDAAMALGARRAAGLVAHAGSEAFDRVHTTRQACHDASNSKFTKTLLTPNRCEVGLSTSDQAGRHNMMNFPFFSQRVSAMKSSFQNLGASSGPSFKDRLQQPTMAQTEERLSSFEQSGAATSSANLIPIGQDSNLYARSQETDNLVQISINPVICHEEAGQMELKFNTHNAAVSAEFLENEDVTLTSLSGGSDYSTEKSAKDVSCKRKSFPVGEFECESKNTGGVALQETGPAMARASSVKRTRAAEIHNQSERRRRDKINQKMKALQELIPNANKTDKASMLDEAIEYVKMLQGQLQLMSMRTGMIVPPVMMPPGMQYLSLQQGPNSQVMHMARGPSGAPGAGATDAFNSGVGSLARPVFLGQPFPGQVYHHMAGYPPYRSPSVTHDMHSHLHRDALHKSRATQQLQLVHSQRASRIPTADLDSRKQQTNLP